MVKSRYIWDGHPTFDRNPYNGYINPYYWVDDHPLLYGNNGSLDPGTYEYVSSWWFFTTHLKNMRTVKLDHLPRVSGQKLKKHLKTPPRYVSPCFTL